MVEKTLIPRTQVVQPFLPVRRLKDAVLGAPPVAHPPDFAVEAITGQPVPLGRSECSLLRAFEQFDQRLVAYISEVMFSIDEVIAGKEVSVMFDHGKITARLAKDTKRLLTPQGRLGNLFEYLDLDPPNVLAQPFVEDGAEKVAERFSRYAAAAYAPIAFAFRRHKGQKPQIFGFDLFEEPVHSGGGLDVLCIHHAEDIAGDSVAAEEFVSPHRLLVGGASGLGDAVRVVHFLRAVQTEPHGKFFFRQKLAPVFIDEDAVGLNPVGYATAGGFVFSLKRRDLAKVVHPQEGGLPPVPGESDHPIGGGFDVLDDVLFLVMELSG